jgi:hypothetical protein
MIARLAAEGWRGLGHAIPISPILAHNAFYADIGIIDIKDEYWLEHGPRRGIGIVVVELQTSAFRAASTLPIYERATIAVPPPHDALYRSRNVPR